MLDEKGLGAVIDWRHRSHDDLLFRMERLPLYDVPGQNADRAAFLGGYAPDWARKQAWYDVLAECAERGLISCRVRVFSADLTDDQLMSCHFSYPYSGRWQETRILRHGEHPVPDLLDHDYWIVEPADGDRQVLRMHYSDGGEFVGAEELPAAAHALYRDERDRAWATAQPFAAWWADHPELHREAAVAP